MHSVAQQNLEPGYGYLRITSFSETTADDVSRAVAQLKRDNPGGLRGLVLDLRNNPGGVLEAGVAVADAFLNEGVIVPLTGRTATRVSAWTPLRAISSTARRWSCS